MEITARDLRIGNYVNYRIQDDLDERKDWLECSVIDANDLVILESGIDCDYQPIPLTEDWLLKFGCIEQKIRSFKSNFWNKELDFSVDVYYYEKGKSKVFQYLVNNQHRKKQIMYVHQLQNLHFELKDAELTLTK